LGRDTGEYTDIRQHARARLLCYVGGWTCTNPWLMRAGAAH
jgi:hypothetical protein